MPLSVHLLKLAVVQFSSRLILGGQAVLTSAPKSITSHSEEVTCPLYSALVQLYLEHCVLFCAQNLTRMWRSSNVSRRSEQIWTGLESMAWEEQLRPLGLSPWREGAWEATSWLSMASWGGKAERKVLISSPWKAVKGCVEMCQSCTRLSLHSTLGLVTLPRGCSSAGTGFLGVVVSPTRLTVLGQYLTNKF